MSVVVMIYSTIIVLIIMSLIFENEQLDNNIDTAFYINCCPSSPKFNLTIAGSEIIHSFYHQKLQ